jgi:hypothetical protein
MSNELDRTDAKDNKKKAYAAPRLEVYGDIREIALAVGMSGAADGSLHGQNKTG